MKTEKEAFIEPHKTPGGPSIIMKFAIIPEFISKLLKVSGFKPQENRCDNNFRSCGVTVKEIICHVLKSV